MMEQKIVRDGEQATIVLKGELVASCLSQLKADWKELISQGVKEIIIDIGQVSMIDSMGIGLLVATHGSLSKSNGRLSLVHASADLLELFQAIHLHKHFNISGD